MNKYLVIFFISCFIAPQTLFANSCSIHYQKVFFDRKAEFKMMKLSHHRVNELFERIEGHVISKQQKLEDIEEIYNALGYFYRKKTEQVNELMKNSAGKISKSMLPIYRAQIETDAIRELVPYNNRMIKHIHDLMMEKGIAVKIESRVLMKEFKIDLLSLDTSGPSSFESIKAIQHYKHRFGTKSVTFDLFHNMQRGSGGFSQAINKRIDLGISGIKSIFSDDLVTMVGKHEFHHAAFANMRVNGKKSIYHSSYLATSEANISSIPNHYGRYMSAEELYNWANNPWWASNRLKDPSKYSLDDILSDLDEINFYTKESTKIAKQTGEVSQSFVKHIEKMEGDLKNSKGIYFEFLNAGDELSTSLDDVYYMVFIKDDGVILKYYVDETILPLVKKVQNYRLDLLTEFNKEAAKYKLNPHQLETLKDEFLGESLKGVEAELSQVFNIIKKDQAALSQVAKVMDVEAMKLEKNMKKIFDEIKVAQGLTPDFYLTPSWRARFDEMSKDYRRFGNIVKENYKGFAGN